MQVHVICSWHRRKQDLLRFPPKKFKGAVYTKTRISEHGETDRCKNMVYFVQDNSQQMALQDSLLLKRLTRMPEMSKYSDCQVILSCKYLPAGEGNGPHEAIGEVAYQYTVKVIQKEGEIHSQTLVTAKPWGFLSEPRSLLKALNNDDWGPFHLIPVGLDDGEEPLGEVQKTFKDAVIAAYKADFTLRFEGLSVYFSDSEGTGIQHGDFNHIAEEWEYLLQDLKNAWDDPETQDFHKLALLGICETTSRFMKSLAPYDKSAIRCKHEVRRALSFVSWLNKCLVLPLDLSDDLKQAEDVGRVLKFLANPAEFALAHAPAPSLAEEVSAFIQRLCNIAFYPELDSKLRTLTKELEKKLRFYTENSEARALSYLQKGMVWRTKYWNFEFCRTLVRDFIDWSVPPYKIVHPWTGQIKWQGGNSPLHFLEVFGYYLAIFSHHLMYTPAIYPSNPDDSTWTRTDLHRVAGDKFSLIHNWSGAALYQEAGCIFMLTSESILKIDLSPLNKDQPPVCSTLVESTQNPAQFANGETSPKFKAAAMSRQFSVCALEPSGFQINAFSTLTLDPVQSSVIAEEFKDKKNCQAEKLFLFQNDLLVAWYPTQPMLVSFRMTRASAGVSLEMTSLMQMASGWSDRSQRPAPQVLDCWGKIPLILTRTSTKKGLNLSLYSVFNQKLQQIGQTHTVKLAPIIDGILRHQRDFAPYFFDRKTRRVSFYAISGRYGEGYTISVHPLKLLLN